MKNITFRRRELYKMLIQIDLVMPQEGLNQATCGITKSRRDQQVVQLASKKCTKTRGNGNSIREEKLLHLQKKKKGFFEAMLDLSQEESELTVEEWIASLEQKKILLSCIEEIDAELMPFQQSLHDLSQEISEELEHI